MMLKIIEEPGEFGFIDEHFYTVFPKDPDKLPQDFPTYEEAKQFADAEYGAGNYEIESPC